MPASWISPPMTRRTWRASCRAGRYRWEVSDAVERRAIEPAISCRLVGRGGAARRAGQARGGAGQAELPAWRDRQAVHQGAVRRRGRAGDRLGPGTVVARVEPAGRGRHDRDPRRSRPGAAASMRWSAPIGPSGCARAAAAWARARRRGRLARDRQQRPAPSPRRLPHPTSRVRAARSKSRSRWRGSMPARRPMSPLAAVDEAVLKLTEFDEPGARRNTISASAGSGSNCATSTAG